MSIGLPKEEQLKSGRLRQKPKHKNSRRGQMFLPTFIRYMKNNYHGDAHHWITKGREGTLDCFISMIPPDKHKEIHANGYGVNGFIEERGFVNLVMESMDYLEEFCGSEICDPAQALILTDLISDIRRSPDEAIGIAKEYATEHKFKKRD